MQISILTSKAEGLYCAYTPEWGVVCYGGCQDEAVNNLHDEISILSEAEAKEGNGVE